MSNLEKAKKIVSALERIDRRICLRVEDVVAKCTQKELDFYYEKLVVTCK